MANSATNDVGEHRETTPVDSTEQKLLCRSGDANPTEASSSPDLSRHLMATLSDPPPIDDVLPLKLSALKSDAIAKEKKEKKKKKRRSSSIRSTNTDETKDGELEATRLDNQQPPATPTFLNVPKKAHSIVRRRSASLGSNSSSSSDYSLDNTPQSSVENLLDESATAASPPSSPHSTMTAEGELGLGMLDRPRNRKSADRRLQRADGTWHIDKNLGVPRESSTSVSPVRSSSASTSPSSSKRNTPPSLSVSTTGTQSDSKLAASSPLGSRIARRDKRRRASTLGDEKKTFALLLEQQREAEERLQKSRRDKRASQDKQLRERQEQGREGRDSGEYRAIDYADGTEDKPKTTSAWKRKAGLNNKSPTLGPLLELVASSATENEEEVDALFAELLRQSGDEKEYQDFREQFSSSSLRLSSSNKKTSERGSTLGGSTRVKRGSKMKVTDTGFYSSPTSSQNSPLNHDSSGRKLRGSFRKKKDKDGDKEEGEKEKEKDKERDKEKEKAEKVEKKAGKSKRFNIRGSSAGEKKKSSSRKASLQYPEISAPSSPMSLSGSPAMNNATASQRALHLRSDEEWNALMDKYQGEYKRRIEAESEITALRSALEQSGISMAPSGKSSNTSQTESPSGSAPGSKKGSKRGSSRGGSGRGGSQQFQRGAVWKKGDKPSGAVVVVVQSDSNYLSDDDFMSSMTEMGEGTEFDDESDGEVSQIEMLAPRKEPRPPSCEVKKKMVISFTGDLSDVLAPAQVARIAQMSRPKSTLFPLDEAKRLKKMRHESIGTETVISDDELEQLENALILHESAEEVNLRAKPDPAKELAKEIELRKETELEHLRRTVEKQQRQLAELESVLARYVGVDPSQSAIQNAAHATVTSTTAATPITTSTPSVDISATPSEEKPTTQDNEKQKEKAEQGPKTEKEKEKDKTPAIVEKAVE